MTEHKIWATMENGNIEIRPLTEKLFNESKELIKKYYFREPISHYSGLSNNSVAMDEIVSVFKLLAKDGTSLVAIDNSTEKVVGIYISNFEIKDNAFDFFEETKKLCTQKESLAFIAFEEKACGDFNVFEEYNIDAFMEFDFGTVADSHKNRGIFKCLMQTAIDLARRMANGEDVRQSMDGTKLPPLVVPKLVMGTSSNKVSALCCFKEGFVEVKTVPHREFFGECVNENNYWENENITNLMLPLMKNEL